MAEKKTVKQEGLTVMNWVDAQTAHVNARAKSVQDATKIGAMCNDSEGGKMWDYTIGKMAE